MQRGLAEAAVRQLLWHIGEDAQREGLLETPRRLVRALEEMTSGYDVDPAALLSVQFPDARSGQLVAVQGIEFYSLCEHHMLPFFGSVDIAYRPLDRVVGLSKFARLVDVFARRLQVQERFTAQIADAIAGHVPSAGVAVQVQARHFCMCARGVRKPGPSMITQEWRGEFATDDAARMEFLVAMATGARQRGRTRR